MIFLQTYEWWGFDLQSWVEQAGKYLALKVLAKRDWGYWQILQYCLLSIAWFMYLNFVIPNPPSFLGWLILSQLIRWSLFSLWSWPHQKAQIIEFILLQTCFGTLKHEKEYNGRDWRTEAIKVVLPAWDKSFIFQPWNFAFSLLIRNWKSTTLLPLNLNWTPRYLLGCWTRLTWRDLARPTCSSIGMFGEQNRSDLVKLIDWPEMEQYHFRMSWRFWTKILSFLHWEKSEQWRKMLEKKSRNWK